MAVLGLDASVQGLGICVEPSDLAGRSGGAALGWNVRRPDSRAGDRGGVLARLTGLRGRNKVSIVATVTNRGSPSSASRLTERVFGRLPVFLEGWAGRRLRWSGRGAHGAWWVVAALFVGIHGWMGTAFAQPVSQGAEPEAEDRTVARRMADEAAQLYEAGDFAAAQDLFARAYAVYPAPTLVLWEARSLDKIGRLVEAEERYAAVLRYTIQPNDPDVFREAASEASQEIVRLRERIPTFTIRLKGQQSEQPGIEVEIDGRLIKPALLGYPIPVDPGLRTIVVRLNQVERFRQTIAAEERGRRSVDVWLNPPLDVNSSVGPAGVGATNGLGKEGASSAEPTESEEGSWDLHRILGWSSLGLGVIGATTGVVAGVVASSKYDTIETKCTRGVCLTPYHDDLDAFRRYRTVSTVGYVVGALGAAAGVTLLLTAPARPQAAGQTIDRMAVRLRVGHADVRVSF